MAVKTTEGRRHPALHFLRGFALSHPRSCCTYDSATLLAEGKRNRVACAASAGSRFGHVRSFEWVVVGFDCLLGLLRSNFLRGVAGL